MTDSFLHEHQSALDSQREDKAIQDLQDAGIYPDPTNKNTKTIISQLEEITQILDDLIEKETTTYYPDRELPASSLTDLEEAYDLLEKIVNYEPTDHQMMSSFGSKWHDGL